METNLPKFQISGFRDKCDASKFIHGMLSDKVIACAIAVHKELGPGFLESIYEEAMCLELNQKKMPYQRQLPIVVCYKGTAVGMHKVDLLIDGKIVVELKAVKDIDNSHLATCLSYLKATSVQVGLVINFSRSTIHVRRVVRTELIAEAGSAEGAEKKIRKV